MSHHRHHDGCAEHPEDVVEEEPRQQDDPCGDGSQGEVLDALNTECQAQCIVGQPMLLLKVPTENTGFVSNHAVAGAISAVATRNRCQASCMVGQPASP